MECLLGIYKPAKWLAMTPNNITVRAVELHIECNELHSYLHKTGGSDIGRIRRVYTILEGKHVKPGLCSQLIRFKSLLALCSEFFFAKH